MSSSPPIFPPPDYDDDDNHNQQNNDPYHLTLRYPNDCNVNYVDDDEDTIIDGIHVQQRRKFPTTISNRNKNCNNEQESTMNNTSKSNTNNQNNPTRLLCCLIWCPSNPNNCKGEQLANAIDRKCRFIFPLTFIVFNIIYWWVYTQMEGNIQHNIDMSSTSS